MAAAGTTTAAVAEAISVGEATTPADPTPLIG